MKKILLFVIMGGASAAAAYEPIADLRRVEVFSTGGNSVSEPDAPFADFEVPGQSTFFFEDEINGTLSGFGESDFDFFVRQSIFDITFSLVQDEPFEILGLATGNGGNFGLARAQVRLFEGDQIDSDRAVFLWSFDVDRLEELSDSFDYSEDIPAGDYRLVIQTDITPGGFDTYMDISFAVLLLGPPDFDDDGVINSIDNCINAANIDQLDGDADGFGNACDADFNNDCIVNVTDLGILRGAFFSADVVSDLNGDGVVNVIDLGLMRAAFFSRPGPSGLTQECWLTP